jgi:MbtH protein
LNTPFTDLSKQKDISMSEHEEDAGRFYKVVRNDEEQFSIWFADREIPRGWQDVGKSGSKADCLAYIDEIWTDMRPLSLRRQMEQVAEGYGTAPGAPIVV